MRALFVCLLGAAAGVILCAVFGPSLLTWWGTPPVRTSCDCAPNMLWAMGHLVWAQLILGVAGASLFLLLYLLLFRRGSKPRPSTES
jgi:hypothetical protein